jgi:hypothetical protein
LACALGARLARFGRAVVTLAGNWAAGLEDVRQQILDLAFPLLAAAGQGSRVLLQLTAGLLEPYGEWAGLASIYLLAAYRLGLVPPHTAAA